MARRAAQSREAIASRTQGTGEEGQWKNTVEREEWTRNGREREATKIRRMESRHRPRR